MFLAHDLLGSSPEGSDGRRGFSLPELLVVLAILGLSIALVVPLVSHEVRRARIRGAVPQFVADLRVARTIAVSTRQTVNVQVVTDPGNEYVYQDARGKQWRIVLPEGIRILSSSPSPIAFRKDGSVPPNGSMTVFEATVPGRGVEHWTVRTSYLGISGASREDAP